MSGAVGINLVGDPDSEGAHAQLARQLLLALDEAGIPVHQVHDLEHAPFAVNIVCSATAEDLPQAVETWDAADLPVPVSLPAGGVWPDRRRHGLPDDFVALVLEEGAEPRAQLLTGANVPMATVSSEWDEIQRLASVDCLVIVGRPPGAALDVGRAMLLERPVVAGSVAVDELPAGGQITIAEDAAEREEALRAIADGLANAEPRLAAAKEVVEREHAPTLVGDRLRHRLAAVSGASERATEATLSRCKAAASARRTERRLAELARRIEDVAHARDDLERVISSVVEDPLRPPRHIVARAHPFAEIAQLKAPDEAPWTHGYNAAHRALVAEAILAPDLEIVLGPGGRLPSGYGRGFDERVIELPWVFAQGLDGRALDAGSALNHPHLLDPLQREVSTLDVVTLAPEEWSYPERGISYVYADLRELPYRDGHFDTIACISTLDHVGMDNSSYGADAQRATDPAAEVDRAVAELVRVLAPNGQLLITVPYGAAEDHGWLRQFDRAGVERIVAAAAPLLGEVEVFGYDESGWRRSSFDEQAGARYRDYRADQGPVPDGAVAARAVACIRLSRP